MRQVSVACEQNKDAILAVIKPMLLPCKKLLEIGSGTGQHAAYFANSLEQITWQTSDREQTNLSSISAWLSEAKLSNTPAPINLDVNQNDWKITTKIDAVFSANTVHIMSLLSVQKFFKGVGQLLTKKGLFILYGPFNYNGAYTSQSNAEFDQWLKQQNPKSAIRDFEQLNTWAMQQNLFLKQDVAMPANNRILCWQKH